MNSVFSSFDFLCAELLGMKVKAHVPPAANTGGGGEGAPDVPRTGNEGENVTEQEQKPKQKESFPSPLRRGEGAPDVPRTGNEGENVTEREQKPRQKESFPRFALELDGIHCFETIVPD